MNHLLIAIALLLLGCETPRDIAIRHQSREQVNAHFAKWRRTHSPDGLVTCYYYDQGTTVRCTVSDDRWTKPMQVVCTYKGCDIGET